MSSLLWAHCEWKLLHCVWFVFFVALPPGKKTLGFSGVSKKRASLCFFLRDFFGGSAPPPNFRSPGFGKIFIMPSPSPGNVSRHPAVTRIFRSCQSPKSETVKFPPPPSPFLRKKGGFLSERISIDRFPSFPSSFCFDGGLGPCPLPPS